MEVENLSQLLKLIRDDITDLEERVKRLECQNQSRQWVKCYDHGVSGMEEVGLRTAD